MDFRIADTFTDSLAKLTGDEQKAVKTTAFDLQLNPAQPGLQLHRIDRARDPNFWSVRVSRDIRLIVHRSEASLSLCYVGHHDDAYDLVQRHRLKTSPLTRADLDDFAAGYNSANRHDRTENERFRPFTYEELVKRDKANLDIFWLRDESVEDSAGLPPPEVLADEIVEDLRAALEQFEEIGADLTLRGSPTGELGNPVSD